MTRGETEGRGRARSEHRAAVHEVGHLLATEGKLEAARTIFQGWLSLEPDDAFSHLALGWIHRRAGRVAEAKAALRRVLERTPESMVAAPRTVELGWRAAIALAEIELASDSPQAAARVLKERLRWSGGAIPSEIEARVSTLLRVASS